MIRQQAFQPRLRHSLPCLEKGSRRRQGPTERQVPGRVFHRACSGQRFDALIMRQETGELAGLEAGFHVFRRQAAVGVKIVEDNTVMKTALFLAVLPYFGSIAQG